MSACTVTYGDCTEYSPPPSCRPMLPDVLKSLPALGLAEEEDEDEEDGAFSKGFIE